MYEMCENKDILKVSISQWITWIMSVLMIAVMYNENTHKLYHCIVRMYSVFIRE